MKTLVLPYTAVCALSFIPEQVLWLCSINKWEIKLYISDLLDQASSKKIISEVCHKVRESSMLLS